jgi:acyl-CoA thioesterase I
MWFRFRPILFSLAIISNYGSTTLADNSNRDETWPYSATLLRPFWESNIMYGESVLFLKDAEGKEARASVLFPVDKMIELRNAPGNIQYEDGKDYKWEKGSREIILPANSRIVCCKPSDLRRPPNTQPYHLPHRDGNGDILFGGRLEYHELQTCVTYVHDPQELEFTSSKFKEQALSRTLGKLRNGAALSVVVVGDSISTGCNASGWAGGPPFQPAYPELVRQILEHQYGSRVSLTNLSVSGQSTPWALTMVDKVIESTPDLVIVAFGMNDASGRSAREYQANTKSLIEKVRAHMPDAEFILVASMIGNRNWTALKQELFPAYRDSLQELSGPGVALADVTTVWSEFLKRKQDWDQTGNGVNHPNDFGHRVYAQVISTLLVPSDQWSIDKGR